MICRWKKLPIPYAWKLGQFSRNDQVQRVYRDHWHTGFTLDNYRIHIDYIDGPHGAGHVQRREYRIFLNGEEIARGGGRLGWNMAVWGNIRNFPLIVPVDSYLIYIDGFLQPFGSEYCIGHIAPNNVLSIFQEYWNLVVIENWTLCLLWVSWFSCLFSVASSYRLSG